MPQPWRWQVIAGERGGMRSLGSMAWGVMASMIGIVTELGVALQGVLVMGI